MMTNGAATGPSELMTMFAERADLDEQLERYRYELTTHCGRTLGSMFEAEDAVQETFVRAWRAFDGFEGRSSLRTWLYRIATNVCLDMRTAVQRRALPMDVASWQTAGRATQRDAVRFEPTATCHSHTSDDPADRAVAHDSIHQAFVAALLHLPARQRSVLILRDVLRWQATEVAELLDITVAAANSALQRGRSALAARRCTPGRTYPITDDQRPLLQRYVESFERYDLDSLVSLLRVGVDRPTSR